MVARTSRARRIVRLFLQLATLLSLPISFERAAGQSRAQMLVTTDWLRQHLKDTDLVLLHVGEKPGYDAEHIPGARFITMDDVAAPRPAERTSGEALELPVPATARARLEALGISDGSRIIVYYGKDWVSQSTRIAFTLDWLGLGARVFILDGGMQAWKRAGGAVTVEVPTVQSGKLSATPVKNVTVTKEWVNANRAKPGVALIDARAAVFYDGVQAGRNKLGHIPGARNIPFNTLHDDALVLKSPAELAKMFANAGVKAGDTVVGYCHIGQQATAMLFAARTLGFNVLLYDGSFTEWEKHDLPVELTAPKGVPER
jgi:thiosulfate/3-mercaptopyruvate sulfurtransferase